ncbi:MAG: hypothetical protein ACRCWR_11235, partial [Saezia sp.]
ANHSTFLLENTTYSSTDILALPEYQQRKLWSQVVELAPYPLIDSWREPVMKEIIEKDMIKVLPPLFGELACWRIQLNAELIKKFISDRIRSGSLTAETSLQAQLF